MTLVPVAVARSTKTVVGIIKPRLRGGKRMLLAIEMLKR